MASIKLFSNKDKAVRKAEQLNKRSQKQVKVVSWRGSYYLKRGEDVYFTNGRWQHYDLGGHTFGSFL
jgi:hypothetical protein